MGLRIGEKVGYNAPLNCLTFGYSAPCCLQVVNSPSLWLWCSLLPSQVANSPSSQLWCSQLSLWMSNRPTLPPTFGLCHLARIVPRLVTYNQTRLWRSHGQDGISPFSWGSFQGQRSGITTAASCLGSLGDGTPLCPMAVNCPIWVMELLSAP
jgi:hypothetical protein